MRNVKKVKVSPIYDQYVGECLLERTLVLSHRLFEVGWPVPFLAAFISPVFPPGPHSLLGGQGASVQPLVLGGSRTVVFGTVGKRSNGYATRTHTMRNVHYIKRAEKCLILLKLEMLQCFSFIPYGSIPIKTAEQSF